MKIKASVILYCFLLTFCTSVSYDVFAAIHDAPCSLSQTRLEQLSSIHGKGIIPNINLVAETISSPFHSKNNFSGLKRVFPSPRSVHFSSCHPGPSPLQHPSLPKYLLHHLLRV